MREPSVETLFERWRVRGDVAALGAVFDRTAPDLLALGAHLVRDPVEAEDLVQATFLAAIEGAAAYERGRRLEAWLAGILVKKALRVRRDRARRPDPARLAEPTADPARAAEQRELAARLREALAALDEPYRGVLAAYLDGAKPHAIARASGRAAGTVRMQLLRGLERLRRLLPAGLWALVPVRVPRGLEGLRAEVLARGASAGAAPAAVSVAGIGTAELALAGAALLVVASLLLASVERGVGGRSAPSSAAISGDPASRASELVAPQPVAGAPAPARAPSAPPPAAPVAPPASLFPVPAGRAGFFLVGEVLGLDGADPRAVAITVASRGAGAAHGRPDGTGRFAVDVTRMLEHGTVPVLYVTAEHPDGFRAAVERPVEDDVRAASAYDRTELRQDVALARLTLVHGRVTVHEGDVEDVLVALLGRGAAGELVGTHETRCGPDGAFVLEARAGGEHVVVARRSGTPPAARAVHVEAGARHDAGTLRLEPGGVALAGAIRLPFAAELAQLRVVATRVGASESWNGVGLHGGALAVLEERAGVRVDGAFRLEGLEPGTYELWLESEGSVIAPGSVVATATAPADGVEIGAALGITRVTVRNASRRTASPELEVATPDTSLERTVAWDRPVDVVSDRRVALTLTARAPGLRAARRELPAGRAAVADAVELVLEPDRALAALEIALRTPPGARAPRACTVAGTPLGAAGEAFTRAAGVSHGALGLADLAPGRYALLVVPGERGEWMESFLAAPALEVDLAPGATERVELAWTEGGRARFHPRGTGAGGLRARVRDGGGRDVAVRFARRELAGGGFRSSLSTGYLPDGPSELEPNLPPGRYELVLSDGDVERLGVPFTIVANAIVDVPLDLP